MCCFLLPASILEGKRLSQDLKFLFFFPLTQDSSTIFQLGSLLRQKTMYYFASKAKLSPMSEGIGTPMYSGESEISGFAG